MSLTPIRRVFRLEADGSLPEVWDKIAAWLLPITTLVGFIHIYLVWFASPNWVLSPFVVAPLTRKLLFFHPASAWTSFLAYTLVFAFSIYALNEHSLRFGRGAKAAAEVGFVMNTIALWTGTMWGLPEWSRSGENGLQTIYSEPKVMVVLVLWLSFLAYLILDRVLDDPIRKSNLLAIFGILGFVFVPISFLTSRIIQTSLHPDIAGPGANPDADVSPAVGMVLGFSTILFGLLFLQLFLLRFRILDLESKHQVQHE